MEIKQTIVLESSEPLSKALPQLMENPAVIVTKKGKYLGVIDHRSVGQNIKHPTNTKCETAITRPPVMEKEASMVQLMSAFLLGHFKALPVVNSKYSPLGITTRVELLKEMVGENAIPNVKVTDLMSTPVYSISESKTVGDLKKFLRQKGARRAVVLRKDFPIGVVSTFDIGAWESKPNFAPGRLDIKRAKKLNIDDMSISDFLRPDITKVSDKETVLGTAKRMIKKEVSSVVVTSGKKAVGVLSALDIFKMVQGIGQEKTIINMSGLNEETISHYDHIDGKIGHTLGKFSDSFNIRNVRLHVKEGKSTFDVKLNFDTNMGKIAVRSERATLKGAVNEMAVELDKILRRKKDMRRGKTRTKHYKRGRER